MLNTLICWDGLKFVTLSECTLLDKMWYDTIKKKNNCNLLQILNRRLKV